MRLSVAWIAYSQIPVRLYIAPVKGVGEHTMQATFWTACSFAIWVALLGAGTASAGSLTIVNKGRFPIACTADGWTKATGAAKDHEFIVPTSKAIAVTVAPGDSDHVLDWLQCGAVSFPKLAMAADGANRTLVLTGLQSRSLKVALYPYLPTDPTAGFAALVKHVVDTFQKQNPQVALDAVMDDVGIYSFDDLPVLLTRGGYQVMELDMLYLGFLSQRGLLNPAVKSEQVALPAATATTVYNNTLYGVPSWVCMDFLFSNDAKLAQVTSLDGLVAAMPPPPHGGMSLIGSFTGSWTLLSMYINTYVQRYGYAAIQQAFKMPADPRVIDNLKTLTSYCRNATLNGNPCTNGDVSNSDNKNPGAPERVFAANLAPISLGFSERSFFIAKAGGGQPSTILPVPWSSQSQPLLYADSFVTSAANCPAQSNCTADATAFINLMTGLDMRNYIVKSQDLGKNAPWRTLLVANAAFYKQPEIIQNTVYQQVSKVFNTAKPFPNDFTAALQTTMSQGVCRALQGVTSYTCNPGTRIRTAAGRLAPNENKSSDEYHLAS